MHNIYKASENNRFRFLLGLSGERMLIVIGVNPNTADQFNTDTTTTKVKQFARLNGYDGFCLINLYPKRTGTPDQLPNRIHTATHTINLQTIKELMDRFPQADVLAAWGASVEMRPWLADVRDQIFNLYKNRNWFSLGKLTKQGHPRHPSRIAYATPFLAFYL